MDANATKANVGTDNGPIESPVNNAGTGDGNSGQHHASEESNSGATNDGNSDSGESTRSEYTLNGIPVTDVPGGNGNVASTGGNTDGGTGDGYSAPFGLRADGTPAKKRGRKPGQRNGTATPGGARKAAQNNNLSVKGLERILLSIHTIVAVKAKSPELMLDTSEAKTLAEAIGAVQEHYGFEVSPETAIWVNLVTAMGTVYGPRFVSIWVRKKKEKLENAKPKQPQTPKVDQKQDDAGNTFFDLPGMHAPANNAGFL